MALPHGAVGWYAVCNCVISSSYTRVFFFFFFFFCHLLFFAASLPYIYVFLLLFFKKKYSFFFYLYTLFSPSSDIQRVGEGHPSACLTNYSKGIFLC